MSNSQEKHVSRLAQSKGYRLEKVGKGPHHGQFCLVRMAQGSRVASDILGAGFSFSLQEAEAWLVKAIRSQTQAATGELQPSSFFISDENADSLGPVTLGDLAHDGRLLRCYCRTWSYEREE